VIDVLLNSALPAAERQGAPEWPARIQAAQGDGPPPGWVRMTPGDYAAYRSQHEPAQEAWLAALSASPSPVPQEVSIRQLLAALAAGGWITRADALAAARTGALPETLGAAVTAGMAEDEAFEVQLAWAAMYVADRASRFWSIVVARGIATEAQLDDVFRDAAAR